MTEQQTDEKIAAMINRWRLLRNKMRATRQGFVAPVLDRFTTRLGEISESFPQPKQSGPQQNPQKQNPSSHGKESNVVRAVPCPACGKPILPDSVFCSYCGARLQNQEGQPQQPLSGTSPHEEASGHRTVPRAVGPKSMSK